VRELGTLFSGRGCDLCWVWDASQPVNLWSVQECEPTRQLVECQSQLASRVSPDGGVPLVGLKKSYAARVDILPGVLLRDQGGRRSKDFRVL